MNYQRVTGHIAERIHLRLFGMVAMALSALSIPAGLSAQVVLDSVPELQGIDVVEHLGAYIPLDLEFTDDAGRTVKLSKYFDGEKPVLLILAYYECPMLCNLVLNGVAEAVAKLSWQPGEKFRIVTVSIDPLETYELAAAKKKNYLEKLGMPGADTGWVFLVGEESQSRALADAVGFQYYYVEDKDIYAHAAVVFLLAGDGKITRYLYGIEFPERDLRLGLLEASEGKIGNTIDRILLYCYHYDPDSKGYVVFAQNVMRLGGIVTVLLLVIFLTLLWLRERHRKHLRIQAYKHQPPVRK
jgi:protein SCO1/2